MTLEIDFLTAVSLAGLAYVTGHLLVGRWPALERARIPEPLLGGLLFAVVFLAARVWGLAVEIPTSGRPLDALVALLTTNMGLHVSPIALRKGWRPFALFLCAAGVLFLVQFLIALPWALLTEAPLRTAVITPLSLVGAPFNLNPPAQTAPLEHLFARSHPNLEEVTQGTMMVGVLLGVLLAGTVGRLLLRRANAEPPQPSEEATELRERLAKHAHDWTLLVTLVLALVALAFGVQERLTSSFDALTEDHVPVIVLAYLFGAVFRLGFDRFVGAARFPTRALDELLLGPTMGIVFSYALMSVPLHHLARVTWPLGLGAVLGVAASALAAWLLFPLLARVTDRYYASVIATAFFAITTGWGVVGMGHLRFFMRADGPVKPMPVVMPLNAFFLFPWLAIFMTEALVRIFR